MTAAWHVLSRKLVEAAAKASRLLQTPNVAALSTMLRSPLTHLFGKRQRRLVELPVDELGKSRAQVSLVPTALPSCAQLSVLGNCEPRALARLALTNAAWASAVVEHASAEETWAAWAALSPRPTLQHMQQLCVACTLRLSPSQAIEGLRSMEESAQHTDPLPCPVHSATCAASRNHAPPPAAAVGTERVRRQGSRAWVHTSCDRLATGCWADRPSRGSMMHPRAGLLAHLPRVGPPRGQLRPE